MKNMKKYYVTAWAIVVVIFHLLVFLIPKTETQVQNKTFWVIYFAVMVSLIGQAVCSYIYAKKETKEERFLYIPVVLISYIALLMSLLLSLEALTIAFLPTWFTVIVALLVLAFYALSVIRTMAAAEMVVEVEKKVSQQTNFIRTLTAQAKALDSNASAKIKSYTTKVYEALRYSDPVSTKEIADMDEQIRVAYQKLEEMVRNADETSVQKETDIVCSLIKERNEMCKIYK